MTKLTDLVLATQMSTVFAAGCVYGAHLIDLHANGNWDFSTYLLLMLSVGFMAFPHLVTNKEEA